MKDLALKPRSSRLECRAERQNLGQKNQARRLCPPCHHQAVSQRRRPMEWQQELEKPGCWKHDHWRHRLELHHVLWQTRLLDQVHLFHLVPHVLHENHHGLKMNPWMHGSESRASFPFYGLLSPIVPRGLFNIFSIRIRFDKERKTIPSVILVAATCTSPLTSASKDNKSKVPSVRKQAVSK